ncbi:MAG: 50S ribosome-binding GTPase [Planctomycetales bacterium]|nr:50S ribosome-binding GTPase [Planctomycetales bacterium]
MLNLDDTIAAVSSASVAVVAAGRSILRISGPETFTILSRIATPAQPIEKNRIVLCRVHVEEGLDAEGRVYAFFQPHSYTGQDLAELHLDACGAIVEAVLKKIYRYARPAGPGEFTQRAYLNGRIDLTQAEAVAEIITAANTAQLAAAERLLGGRFSDAVSDVRAGIMDLLGLLEAGLDFAEEDIELVSKDRACARMADFRRQVSDLLEGSIRCERMIDLDSVGLAGVPNAGKSSLLNALLGAERSIVSDARATTRDVLTGVLPLDGLDCVLFDCAGLLLPEDQAAPIHRLSHQASLAALNKAAVVLFCVDAGKRDVTADVQMRKQVAAPAVIYVMTKLDAISPQDTRRRREYLNGRFEADFIPTSAATGEGLGELKERIRTELMRLRAGDREHQDRLTINQRHEQKLMEAVTLLGEAADEMKNDAAEVAAMLLRQTHRLLGGLEREDVSEQILDRIFSRFCIGK